MRKYIEYKNEISDTDLYDGLVGYGLFAEKIPNFLTSVDFLAFTKTLTFPINEKPKDFIRYSSMRNINIPRPMAIPEPFAYSNQANCLADNWTKLQSHFNDKTINDSFKINLSFSSICSHRLILQGDIIICFSRSSSSIVPF